MQLSEHAKEMLTTLVEADPWAMVSGTRSRVEARFAELGGHVEPQGPDGEFKCPFIAVTSSPRVRCKISGKQIGFNSPSPHTCEDFRPMKDPEDVVSELGAEVNALIIIMMDILGCEIEDLVEGFKDQYDALTPRTISGVRPPAPASATFTGPEGAKVHLDLEEVEPGVVKVTDARIEEPDPEPPKGTCDSDAHAFSKAHPKTLSCKNWQPQGKVEIAQEGNLRIESKEPDEGDILIEIRITDLRKGN